ncbi:MAG: D-aminoacylase [Desulfobacteraceae bacterium]|nr:MAG: D-aminoacylase [Desulfobacteraceae bacterium]
MPSEFDLLIRNARIADGTGNPSFAGDVGIRGGKIVSVDRKIDGNARKTIDAAGRVAAPGFIDAHSHDDLFPFLKTDCDEKVLQGVTTTIAGNCGTSPVAVGEAYFPELMDALKFMGAAEIPPSRWFKSFSDYLERLDSVRPGINIGALIGHGSVRIAAMGNANRAPSGAELETMESLVGEAMEAGALGISTGLAYIPGNYAGKEELVCLGRIAARHNGVLTSHIRSERDQVVEAIEEVIAVGDTAGLPVQISHLKTAGTNNWGRSEEVLDLLRRARSKGTEATCDVYPYCASSTSLSALLPYHIMAGGAASYSLRLKDPAVRRAIVREIEENTDWENMLKGTGFDRIVLNRSGIYRDYLGLTLAQIAEKKDVNPYDLIFDLVAAEGHGAGIILFSMDEDDVRRILQSPLSMVGSDGGPKTGSAMNHPRFCGTFPRVLSKYVREEGVLKLEEAIRKMTSFAARTFGIKGKGLLKEGFDADIVVFDPQAVKDCATFENPSAKPEGIDLVIVNGVPAVEDGKLTGNRSGRVIRRGA